MSNTDPSATKTNSSTLLEAVNTLLRAIGQAEVMSLATADMDQRAQGALAVLNEQSVVVQAEGWHFNEETEAVLMPDSGGIIRLPYNVQAFRLAEKSSAENITVRDRKLYNLTKATDRFDKTIRAIITYAFEFSEIPPPIRWYIVCKAGHVFGAGRLRGEPYRFTKETVEEAYSRALQFDTEARDSSEPESSSFRARRRR